MSPRHHTRPYRNIPFPPAQRLSSSFNFNIPIRAPHRSLLNGATNPFIPLPGFSPVICRPHHQCPFLDSQPFLRGNSPRHRRLRITRSPSRHSAAVIVHGPDALPVVDDLCSPPIFSVTCAHMPSPAIIELSTDSQSHRVWLSLILSTAMSHDLDFDGQTGYLIKCLCGPALPALPFYCHVILVY